MHTHLNRLVLAAIGASIVTGAMLAILPALVVGLVTLFYNSAGGVLVLLGSLISLLPRPSVAVAGDSSSLPIFQVLQTGSAVILLRSGASTVLCSTAFALMVTQQRQRDHRAWLAIGVCCILAAIAGGAVVGWALAPAIALSGLQLAVRLRRDG